MPKRVSQRGGGRQGIHVMTKVKYSPVTRLKCKLVIAESTKGKSSLKKVVCSFIRVHTIVFQS